VFRRLGVPAERIVRCRDVEGRAAQIAVCRVGGSVVMSVSSSSPVRLTSRQSHRLYEVLKAVDELDSVG
jgi:hypothetical protein